MAGNAQVGLSVVLNDALSSGLNVLNVNMGNFGLNLLNLVNFANNTSNALSALVPWFAALGGASVAFSLFAGAENDVIQQASDLQEALISVQIALNLTNQQMTQVGQSITQIADNSVFSTTQVAQAFAALGEKGFNVTQIMGGVAQAAVNLAEATNSQTVPAANLLAETMQAFGANANQAAYYASALTFAFNNGIPSISELTTSLDQTAEIANQLNMPIGELVSTLDYLNQNGLQASDSATTLRYMLQSLLDPTQSATEQLANLGLITLNQATPAFYKFEDALSGANKTAGETVTNFNGTVMGLQDMYTQAQRVGLIPMNQTFLQWAESMGMLNDKLFDSKGNFKDFYSILQLLGNSLDGLSQQQKSMALQNLFNVTSGKGAGLLLDNINKTMGALNGLNNSFNTFTQSSGAIKDADERTAGFSATVQKLQTTFGSFLAQIGTPLLGPLTAILNTFNNLISTTSKGGTSLSTFGATFLTLGTVLSGLAVVAGALILPFVAFGGVLAPIAGIAAGVIAGIAGLSALGGLIAANWGTVGPILQTAGAALLGVIAAGVGIAGLIELVNGASAAFFGLTSISWGPLISSLGAVALGTLQVGLRAIVAAGQTAMYVVMQTGGVLPATVAVTGALLAQAAAWMLANGPIILVIAAFAAAGIGLVALVQHFGGLQALLRVGQSLFGALGKELSSIGGEIKTTVVQAIQQLQPVWNQLTAAFKEAEPVFLVLGAGLGAIAALIVGVVVGAFNGLLHVIVPVIQTIVGVIRGLITVVMGIAQIFTGVFTIINGIVHGNGKMIQDGFKQIGQGVLGIFSGLWTAVSSLFVGWFNIIRGFVSGFISGFIGFFQHLFDVLVGHSIIPDLVKSILSWIGSLPSKGLTLIENFVSSIINGAKGLWGKFNSSVLDPITKGISGFISGALSWGENLMKMLGQGIANGIGSVLNQIGNLGGKIKGMLGFHSPTKEGVLSESGSWMPNMMKMYAAGIESNIPLLQRSMSRVQNILAPGSITHPSFGSSISIAGSGSGGTSTINLVVDGRQMSQVVINHATNELKMNGVGRSNR